MFETHRDSTGNEILIAAMDDQHLQNTVKLKCRQIAQALGSVVQISDPAKAALYGVKAKSPEEAGEAARKVAVRLYPYLAEALLRGGEPAAVCAEAIRTAIGRDASLAVNVAYQALPNHTETEGF